MPTEADFRDAAVRLRRVVDDVDAARRHVANVQRTDAIAGGSVATTVARSCEHSAAVATVIRDRVTALVDQCERRAVVCAEHEAALRAWERAHDRWSEARRRYELARSVEDWFVPWPGSRPVRPVAPYEWVDPK